MAGELGRFSDGIPIVADATTRDILFPLAARAQNQRVFRLDTRNTERWNGAAWIVDTQFIATPGDGRTVADITDYLANNAVFNGKDYGMGAGVSDNASAFIASLDAATLSGSIAGSVYIPHGAYAFSTFGNLAAYAKYGLQIIGDGSARTVLRCTSTVAAHNALYIDAFEPGLTGDDASAPYLRRCNLRGLTIQGNSLTAAIVRAQGVSHSWWEDVVAREAEPTAGIAFHFSGMQLNWFGGVVCSTNVDAMTSKPYEGLRLEAGRRDSMSIGNSSNNAFPSLYMEGLSVGVRIAGGDQNTFEAGAAEANSVNDVLVADGSRYNLFKAFGTETPLGLTPTSNISDAGQWTVFLNCYTNGNFFFAGTARQCCLWGGVHNKITIQTGATKCTVKDVGFNSGGGSVSAAWSDSGTDTVPEHLWDLTGLAFYYPQKPRTNITVGASPFTYQNTTGRYIEVVLQSGTISALTQARGGDTWSVSPAIPSQHLLAPTDSLTVTYTVAPGMSAVPHAGFQG